MFRRKAVLMWSCSVHTKRLASTLRYRLCVLWSMDAPSFSFIPFCVGKDKYRGKPVHRKVHFYKLPGLALMSQFRKRAWSVVMVVVVVVVRSSGSSMSISSSASSSSSSSSSSCCCCAFTQRNACLIKDCGTHSKIRHVISFLFPLLVPRHYYLPQCTKHFQQVRDFIVPDN
jgi:hypothetical protein